MNVDIVIITITTFSSYCYFLLLVSSYIIVIILSIKLIRLQMSVVRRPWHPWTKISWTGSSAARLTTRPRYAEPLGPGRIWLDQLAGEEDKGPIVYVAFGSIVRPSKDPGLSVAADFFGAFNWPSDSWTLKQAHMSIRKFQAFLNVQTLLCQWWYFDFTLKRKPRTIMW